MGIDKQDGYERHCPRAFVYSAEPRSATVSASRPVSPGPGDHPRRRVWRRLHWFTHDIPSILLNGALC